MIKFGIVGCGTVSETHAKAITEMEEAVLFGVCDMSAERAKEFAGKYNTMAFESYEKMLSVGVDSDKYLENNDSYHALKSIDSLIITGPTGTNVNDVSVALIGRKRS